MTHDDDDLDGNLQPNDPFEHDHDTVLQSAEGDSLAATAPSAPTRAITPPTSQPKPAVPRVPVGRGSNARPVAAPSATPAVAAPVERRSRPKLLSRTDIVPELRKDLRIERVAEGYCLQDPSSKREQALNEYEVSLVRMLNGKRPVFELLEAVERLGIPVNLESLQKFVVQLEQRGFLRPPQTVDAALDQAVEAAWPTRGEWESSVRALFQSGIRFLRAGKHAEAIGYFEALLEEDPDNIEARELLEMAKSPPVPTEAKPAERTEKPLTASAKEPTRTAPASMPAATTSAIHAELPPHAPQVRGVRLMPMQYGVIGVVLVLVAMVAYLAFDSRRRGPPAVSTADQIDPTRNPIVVVAPDARRAVIDAPRLAAPDATIPVDPPKSPDPVATQAPIPDKKPRPVIIQQVHAPSTGDVTSFLPVARKVREGEKLFQIERVVGDPAKIKAAAAKVDEMAALAKKDPLYDPFLAEARAELAKVRKVTVIIVKAPRAGKASPKVVHGASVRGGQTLAEIK